MKRVNSFSNTVAFTILFSILVLFGGNLPAQENPGVLKIGVYDSRVIVYAYSRSEMFRDHMKKFGQQNDSAQKAHDTVMLRERSIQAISYQHLLHLMVFGPGPVGALISLVKDLLPEVAKQTGVKMIVNKFEVTYLLCTSDLNENTNLLKKSYENKKCINNHWVDNCNDFPDNLFC